MPALPERSRQFRLAAVIVVSAGAALRLWGIGAGAPYRMSVDEPTVLGRALMMMRSGSFNPHFFDYGGLTLYLHLAVACLRFVAGSLAGKWTSLDQFWEGDFLVWSRFVTASIGAATVYVVYRAGLRWGTVVALVAAIVFALLPQHVRESHLALTDVPLTFFVALALLLSLRASETGRLLLFMGAGIAAGAAAAVKYNGGLAMVMPLAAVAAPAVQGRVRAAAALACVGTFGGFLAGAPYTVLDLPGFLNGFGALAGVYSRRQPLGTAALTYMKYLRGWFTWPGKLPAELGWLAVALAAAGLLAAAAGLLSRTDRPKALVLLPFPLLYFYVISSEGSLQFGRYLLPLSPMLCIMIALGASVIYQMAREAGVWPARAALGAGVLLALLPLTTDIAGSIEQMKPSTAEQAARWIQRNVGRDELLVIEGESVKLPPHYRVQDVNRLSERPIDEYRKEGAAYLVMLADPPSAVDDPVRQGLDLAARIRAELLSGAEVVASFHLPGNPTITILKLPRG